MSQNSSPFQLTTNPESSWRSLRQRFLGIPIEETTFRRRKFRATHFVQQQHLEKVGQIFLYGYHTAIDDADPHSLALSLNKIEPTWRGFAFEGAAMGLALLDALTPWQSSRLFPFLQGAGSEHIYMEYVGLGWIFGRVPGTLRQYLRHLEQKTKSSQIDPLLGWLAIDGYGFSQGYFHGQRYFQQFASPKSLSGYACQVFDQGLGRSLWFFEGANGNAIATTIAAFPDSRQGDLWSGIGLASAYAGGVEQDAIATLIKEAGQYLPQLAQGVAFAAKARQRAKNLTPHLEMVSQTVWGMTAEAAAKVSDQCLVELPVGEKEPSYEIWRHRIQAAFKEMNP